MNRTIFFFWFLLEIYYADTSIFRNLLTCDRNLLTCDRNLIIGDHNLLTIVQGHKDGWLFRVRLFHCNDIAKQLLHSFKLFPGVGWGPPCKYIQGTGILQRKTVSSAGPSSEREGVTLTLTLETSAVRIPVRWSFYIINSIDKTKF